MSNGMKSFIAFSLGAAVGFFAAQKLLKDKYARIAQEEIDSVYESLSRQNPTVEKPVEDIPDEKDEPLSVREYAEKLSKQGYTDYTKMEEKEEDNLDEPYIIEPKEFDTLDDYDAVSLTYYADKVLTDELDNPIEDVEGHVGKEWLDHFGSGDEPDTVYVRNEYLKTDYEINRDAGFYYYDYPDGDYPVED